MAEMRCLSFLAMRKSLLTAWSTSRQSSSWCDEWRRVYAQVIYDLNTAFSQYEVSSLQRVRRPRDWISHIWQQRWRRQFCALNLHVATVQRLSRRVCTHRKWRTSNFAPLFSVVSAMCVNSEKRFPALLPTGDVPVDLWHSIDTWRQSRGCRDVHENTSYCGLKTLLHDHSQHSCAAVLRPIGVVELNGLHISPCHTHSFRALDMKLGVGN